MDVYRSLAFSALVACGGAPPAPVTPAPAPTPPVAEAPRAPDPDLHRPPPHRVLDLDWSKIQLTDDASAAALWKQIAPTGADWDDKLLEIPASHAAPLARALLRGGNFTCAVPPTGDCARPIYDVPAPAPTATLDDPCLRRKLALWAFGQLDDASDLQPAVLAIAALPPPESELVEAAIRAAPAAAQDERLAVLAAAARAGQTELVDAAVGWLDEAHLIAAASKHHIGGALLPLAAATNRAVFLAAVTDEALAPRARIAAMTELATADKLPAELSAALVTATKARDCAVAASAARVLATHGNGRFVPRRPATLKQDVAMRALCVLASYEGLQGADEPPLLASYLPARGLERVTITYDPLSEDDPDGDGDVHTTHEADLVPRAEAVLPEREDLVRALAHCAGPICVSDDHEFRFVWKPQGGALTLTRIELADRPPCVPHK